MYTQPTYTCRKIVIWEQLVSSQKCSSCKQTILSEVAMYFLKILSKKGFNENILKLIYPKINSKNIIPKSTGKSERIESHPSRCLWVSFLNLYQIHSFN